LTDRGKGIQGGAPRARPEGNPVLCIKEGTASKEIAVSSEKLRIQGGKYAALANRKGDLCDDSGEGGAESKRGTPWERGFFFAGQRCHLILQRGGGRDWVASPEEEGRRRGAKEDAKPEKGVDDHSPC